MATNKDLIMDEGNREVSNFTRQVAGFLLPFINHHQEEKNAIKD